MNEVQSQNLFNIENVCIGIAGLGGLGSNIAMMKAILTVSTIFLNISGEKKRNVFPNRCSVLILILILLFMTYC